VYINFNSSLTIGGEVSERLRRIRQRAADVRDTPAQKPNVDLKNGRVTVWVGNVGLKFMAEWHGEEFNIRHAGRISRSQVFDRSAMYVSDGDYQAAVRQATAILLRKNNPEGPETATQARRRRVEENRRAQRSLDI